MKDPKESDWKLYSKNVSDWRERYLKKRNVFFVQGLINPEKTPSECFWESFDELKKETKILRSCFDPHSRSRMTEHMLLMYRRGIIEKEDLDQFSDEIKELLEQLK